MVEKKLNSNIRTYEDFLDLNSTLVFCIECTIQEINALNCTYKYLSENISYILRSNAKNGNKVYLNFLNDIRTLSIETSSIVNGDITYIQKIERLLNTKYSSLISPNILERLSLIIESSKETLIELKNVKKLKNNLDSIKKNLCSITLTINNSKELNTFDKIFEFMNNEWHKIDLSKIDYQLLEQVIMNAYYSIQEGEFDESKISSDFINKFYEEFLKDVKPTDRNVCLPSNPKVISLSMYRKNKYNKNK